MIFPVTYTFHIEILMEQLGLTTDRLMGHMVILQHIIHKLILGLDIPLEYKNIMDLFTHMGIMALHLMAV